MVIVGLSGMAEDGKNMVIIVTSFCLDNRLVVQDNHTLIVRGSRI
jgi:hypothetical protein